MDELKLLESELKDLEKKHLQMFRDMNHRINILENEVDELKEKIYSHLGFV